MRVELRFFAIFREVVGSTCQEREYEPGGTVRDVLAGLEGRLLAGREFAGGVAVLVNGRNVANLDGLDTPLADGDAVDITPPISGGFGAGQPLKDSGEPPR